MTTSLKTPIAFIIFNRPKCTRKVFSEIRAARPEKLYLIADAPRADRPGEAEKCAETRALVEQMIDWPCEVHKNYADENMGCRNRVASGISWVFNHEENTIILEDDCLPDPTFFTFCQAMLARYKEDRNVVQICGSNILRYKPPKPASYFFSRYGVIWGWATWRNRWEDYDPNITLWPQIKKEEKLKPSCLNQEEYKQRITTLDRIYNGQLDTWDYQWSLTKALAQGKSIVPTKNLIKNIGFGAGATHTINPFNRHQFTKLESLPPPYTAPENHSIEFNEKHDALYCKKFYRSERLIKRIASLFKF